MARTPEGANPTQRTNIGRPPRTEAEPKQIKALGLVIAGNSQREVADQLGVNVKTITRWMQEPAVKAEFARHAAAMSAELWTRLAADNEEVWAIFRGLLHSESEPIQLRAVTWYLDRILSLFPIERILEEGPLAMPALPASLLRHIGEQPDRDQGESE